jgi:hypothetical protein
VATGLSESSRACPRAAGRHLEPSPRSCRRSCRVGQTSLKDTCSYPGEGASKYYC